MNMEDFRSMKTEELQNELDRLRRHLFDLRAQAVTEKLADPTQLGKARRGIARILTLLRERGEENIDQNQTRLVALAARAR